MLEFIDKHYIIIMIVSLFLIFALIGYLIDSTRIKKRNNEMVLEEETQIPSVVDEIEEVQETVENPIDTLDITPPNPEKLIPEIEEPEDNV